MKYGKALILSTDVSVLNPSSDTARRMEEYAQLYESVEILVVGRSIPVDAREVRPSVVVHPVPYRSKPLGLFSLWRKASRVAMHGNFTVIYAQDPFWLGVVAWLLSRRCKIPFSVGVYGTDIRNRAFTKESVARRISAVIAPFVFRRADAIQTDGPETVDHLRITYGNKVFFKPMFPANADALVNLSRSTPDIPPLKVLFIGRFEKQKNLNLLEKVIARAHGEFGGAVRFTLVGDGTRKKDFVAGLTRSGAASVVGDRGVLNRDEILSVYGTHHVLILTSFYEGFPRVFMEAALAGMPVITSDVGGIKDLIIDGVTGRVLPQGADVAVWLSALHGLYNPPDTIASMSQAIREQFKKMYGGKTVLDYQRPLAEFLERISHSRRAK
ncbi:MAG: hypothetical protein AMXMBFR44_1190 [Candidatus Campbellbacteria bacterium]